MKVRVITGFLIFVALVASLVLRQVLGNLVFDVFIFVIMLATSYETFRCLNGENSKIIFFVPTLIGFTLSIAGYYVLGFKGILLAFCIGLFISAMFFLFLKNTGLNDLFSMIFIMLYPIGITYCAVYINHDFGGFLGIVLVLTVATFTDTFAYFVGVLFGKLFGGIFGGILAAGLCFLLFEVFEIFNSIADVYSLGGVNKFWIYLIVGIVGALLDTLGDLFASQLKRKCGIKDFGRIFPGHGGVLDRVDGLIFVLPLIVIVSYFAL